MASANFGSWATLEQATMPSLASQILYTSSFFALGSTDGYVADDKQIALQAASEGIPILPEKLRPEMLLLACDAERTSRIKISCNWRKYIICGRFGHSCRHYWKLPLIQPPGT
ncbi:hypothetical protein SDJN03_13713, partial [Cucurbita argyrosperma subsp. sororia]